MSFILHRDSASYPVCLEGFQAGAYELAGKVVEGTIGLTDGDLVALAANIREGS